MENYIFDVNNIDYDDAPTWNLICEGRTKGVFQLESSLGKSWAKRVRPKNLEELAALTALLRPGCLKAIVDGKSIETAKEKLKRMKNTKWITEDYLLGD